MRLSCHVEKFWEEALDQLLDERNFKKTNDKGVVIKGCYVER